MNVNRIFKSDMNLDQFIPQNHVRKNLYIKLYNLLSIHIELPDYDIQKMALNIERGILNNVLKVTRQIVWDEHFKRRYLARAVTVFTNLNPESYLKNTNLIQRLLNKEFDEFELCSFGPDKMFPERWNERMKEYNEEFNKEYKKEEVPDGILRCGKCKSYKTEYNEKFTRAADEPSCKFCYCHNCGHRWRFC